MCGIGSVCGGRGVILKLKFLILLLPHCVENVKILDNYNTVICNRSTQGTCTSEYKCSAFCLLLYFRSTWMHGEKRKRPTLFTTTFCAFSILSQLLDICVATVWLQNCTFVYWLSLIRFNIYATKIAAPDNRHRVVILLYIISLSICLYRNTKVER